MNSAVRPTGNARRRILACIRRLHPTGYVALTDGGRRVDTLAIYACTGGGWRVNVSGAWHTFDDAGSFISAGERNRLAGFRKRVA